MPGIKRDRIAEPQEFRVTVAALQMKRVVTEMVVATVSADDALDSICSGHRRCSMIQVWFHAERKGKVSHRSIDQPRQLSLGQHDFVVHSLQS